MIQTITYITYLTGSNILVYCRKNWPKETIPSNLHMLEDHAAVDFTETWSSPGHEVYGMSMVLNPFIKYSGYCKEDTAQCNQPRYVCRVY